MAAKFNIRSGAVKRIMAELKELSVAGGYDKDFKTQVMEDDIVCVLFKFNFFSLRFTLLFEDLRILHLKVVFITVV
jgi:hypothetical protein